jgi:hypothetical protein
MKIEKILDTYNTIRLVEVIYESDRWVKIYQREFLFWWKPPIIIYSDEWEILKTLYDELLSNTKLFEIKEDSIITFEKSLNTDTYDLKIFKSKITTFKNSKYKINSRLILKDDLEVRSTITFTIQELEFIKTALTNFFK